MKITDVFDGENGLALNLCIKINMNINVYALFICGKCVCGRA